MRIIYDTETIGFHGLPILIQYSEDYGPVNLFDIWNRPIQDTLDLIKYFMSNPGGVIGFNIRFDHFHLTKIHNLFLLAGEEFGYNVNAKDLISTHLEELVQMEKACRDGVALKPVTNLSVVNSSGQGRRKQR